MNLECGRRPLATWFFLLATCVPLSRAAVGQEPSSDASAGAVRITTKPSGLVAGTLEVPVVASAPIERLALYVNGVPRSEATGRTLTTSVNVGYYIRRLRLRAVGYDAQGAVAGEDEMVINDPRPPLRVHLTGPTAWPTEGTVQLSAGILTAAETGANVDFFVGEELAAAHVGAPYTLAVDAARFPAAVYARVVARAGDQEADDVLFFGDLAHDSAAVTLQEVPVSVVGSGPPLRADALTLLDDGAPRPIEGLTAAGDLPLTAILLVDYSESMLEEMPVVKAAARELARRLLRPQDRLAVVGFNQHTYWLTRYTNDPELVASALDRLKPIGETHLYDSVVEMLFELQKTPGRHALVVLTDGADQGSRFELDHLVHYVRYAGVPVYPVIKNRSLSRWMKLGVGRLQARRIARIAEDSGATWFLVERESELAAVYAAIAAELREQVQLVFHSEPTAEDRWHTLTVSSRDGQKLRAPTGYFP
jgi:Ca-activated chloride channel family protein